MPTPSWRLSLLGRPQLRTPDDRPVRFEGKPLALFTLLALERQVTRARLADLLWPGVPEATARNNLVNLLRRLRQTLGTELWTLGDHLSLRPVVEVDLQPLLPDAPGTPPDQLYRSESLLAGQTWPDLPDYSDWLLGWRERLDTIRARLALDACVRAEQAARYPEALEAARYVLIWNPVSEEAHRAVMRLSYLTGNRAAALEAFEVCRTVLREQLRTEPMAPTLELAALIQRGRPVPSTPAAAGAPRRSLRPDRLVGRETLWTSMEQAWTAGQAIILVGEAGAGKSRLAAEFIASKGEALLLEGRPGDTTVPYATAARNLRRILDEVGTERLPSELRVSLARLLPELRGPHHQEQPGTAADEDARLHRSILNVIGLGRSGKAGMIFDDLQYSDDASIEVSVPPDRSDGLSNLVICYRRGELAARHEAALAGLTAAGHAVQLDVTALDEEGVGALLESLPIPGVEQLAPLRQTVMQLSGGNPMLVLEAARHLIDAGQGHAPSGPPLRLEQMLTRRLERLPAGTLPVARAASVLQRDFTPEQIAGMLNLPLLEVADAWEALERAEIMLGDRFSHDLVAEAILNHVPAVVRRLLHRAAARTLAAGSGDPARVARQWLDGGEPLEAVPWLLKAITAAQRTFRLREALEFAGQAARLLEDAGRSEEAFDAWTRRSHLLADLEDRESEQLQAAEALHRTAITPAQRAQAYVQEARLQFRTGDTPGLLRSSELGLTLARSQPDQHLEAELQEALAIALLMSRRPTETHQAWIRLLELGQALQNERFQASAHEGLGYLLSFVQPHSARPHYEQAERGFIAVGDPVRAASTAQKAALLAFQQGEVPTARDTLLRAEGYVRPLEGHHVIRLMLADSLSQIWRAQEEYDRALAVLDQAEQDHGILGVSRLEAIQMQRALLMVRLGEVSQARALLEPLLISPRFPSNLVPQRHLAWAELLSALGRPEEALAACEEAVALLETHDEPFQRVRLALMRSRLVPPEAREATLLPALSLCEQHGYRGLEAAVQVRLGAAALELGHPTPLLPEALPDATQVSQAELWAVRLQKLRQENAAESDLQAAETAAWAWWTAALQRVPEAYRGTFAQANGLTRAVNFGRGPYLTS